MYIDDEKDNCSFERGNERFNYRVGAIIIEDGCVLLVTNESADYYYSVGGRVHIGETAYHAVLREVKEETGVDYEVDRQVFVHENFFTETCGVNKGKKFHEIAMFYLMKPLGKKLKFDDGECIDGKEWLEWVPIEKLKSMRVYPSFLASRINSLPTSIESIVTDETQD
ncbi:MAG: NUDIX domain-containing protein [Clostridiales bacterium]|nr:NUDIX domain-containing protein [Clostridiales bacterium]